MRPISVAIGLATAASANSISTSQTPYAGQIILNGAVATFSINNIATAQDPAGASNLTLVSSPVSFAQPRYVYITSAADDTLLTFTVTGVGVNGQPITETITGANAKARASVNRYVSVSNIAVSGNSGSVQVGSFALATLAETRRVLITAAGNESAKTFTITGTNWSGSVISETITGPNATTAQSVLDYKTITSITISADAAGAITIGTSGVGGSKWVRFDDWAPSAISLQVDVTGTISYTIQTSLDSPDDEVSATTPANMVWVNSSDTAVVAATATAQSNFLFAPRWVRVLVNSGTGTATATFLQSGGVV